MRSKDAQCKCDKRNDLKFPLAVMVFQRFCTGFFFQREPVGGVSTQISFYSAIQFLHDAVLV